MFKHSHFTGYVGQPPSVRPVEHVPLRVKLGYDPRMGQYFAQIGPSVYSSQNYSLDNFLLVIARSDQTDVMDFDLVPGEIKVPRGRGGRAPMKGVVPVNEDQLEYIKRALSETIIALRAEKSQRSDEAERAAALEHDRRERDRAYYLGL